MTSVKALAIAFALGYICRWQQARIITAARWAWSRVQPLLERGLLKLRGR